MAIDVEAASEGANRNIWLKAVRSCKEAERAKIECGFWNVSTRSVMHLDFGDFVCTGRKNECTFTVHFTMRNVVDFPCVAFQRRKNLVRAHVVELNNFIVATRQKLRWVSTRDS